MTTKFDFDDILLVPKTTTNIESRYLDINPYKDNLNFKLPLFNAPMDTVVDVNNYEKFGESKINLVIPRNDGSLTLVNGKIFKSYSIDDFVVKYLMDDVKNKKDYVLIDVANGHMLSILNICKEAKINNPDMVIMAGNIANPETYREYVISNSIDFVRVGIGNGCFIDGTKVTTDNGFKNIEDIEEGDNVLTHKGKYQKVLQTKKIKFCGELIKINDEITCTPDHEFYVLHKKHLKIVNNENIDNLCEWVSAMELSKTTEYLLLEHNNEYENKT